MSYRWRWRKQLHVGVPAVQFGVLSNIVAARFTGGCAKGQDANVVGSWFALGRL